MLSDLIKINCHENIGKTEEEEEEERARRRRLKEESSKISFFSTLAPGGREIGESKAERS